MSRLPADLTIGNAAHEGSSKVRNRGNVADDLASKIDNCGFEVARLIECSNTVCSSTSYGH